MDWKAPDYNPVFAQRIERLGRIRAAIAAERDAKLEPHVLASLHAYYRANPIQFIEDWGMTFDPRNVGTSKPVYLPFVLFPRQREWLEWVLLHWREQRDGLSDKSRDCGLSWCSVALSVTLCLFNEGVAIGFGSRKQEYVDDLGAPRSLLEKARMFIESVPVEFRGGWDRKRHGIHMRLMFPGTGSLLTGEVGDNIGRGDRCSLYFVDEAAHLERPELVDASLSATTNCRIDISSANGTANSFYTKRQKLPPADVFTFHWRDDPRKDDAWYAREKDRLDPIVVAQEIDINYAASVEGIIIPSAWVQSAINAHRKLGIVPTGAMRGALDVADEGRDLNAMAVAHGVVVRSVTAWSGKGDDIFGTVEMAFTLADTESLIGFEYDADGLGAGVRGDARVINERRKANGQRQVTVTAYRGSGEVANPDGPIPSAVSTKAGYGELVRTNKDFFMNRKAQAWWALRVRFQITHRAVTENMPFEPDDIISLDGDMPDLTRLVVELSQATYTPNTVGKIVVDKTPDGQRSPNHADAVVILYSPKPTKRAGFFDV